ncbi:hypothetical protein DHEL01_v203265 [Diaporthe helianthi]|uniref:Uncharacterized protein n=1 Tax=Diaporthe helianthi TaxID=158607 RepID=A0A2P5I752_DIAHE|nr:hypothetical protein DHEL01_v203265 [Diaporthe helianthi]
MRDQLWGLLNRLCLSHDAGDPDLKKFVSEEGKLTAIKDEVQRYPMSTPSASRTSARMRRTLLQHRWLTMARQPTSQAGWLPVSET